MRTSTAAPAAKTASANRPAPIQQGLTAKTNEDISVKYKDADGNPVELSLYVLNTFLAPGENFTAAEAWGYLNLCKARRLNPIEKDVFLVRYGGKPTIVVTRDCYNKRANACPEYDGKESGVIVLTENGILENRKGTVVLDDEELVGAWCDVYLKNHKFPESVTVNFKEVCRYKNDGTPQSTWASQPAWMCVKVAEARALKAAIPEDFSGTYCAEDVGYEEDTSIPSAPAPTVNTQKAASAVFDDAQDVDFAAVDPDTGEVEDDVESLFGE